MKKETKINETNRVKIIGKNEQAYGIGQLRRESEWKNEKLSKRKIMSRETCREKGRLKLRRDREE